MLYLSFTKAILRMFIEKQVSVIERISVQNIDICTLLVNPAFKNNVEFYYKIMKKGLSGNYGKTKQF